MYESSDIQSLFREDVQENHLNTLNKSSLQQYKVSLQSSNITTSSILQDVWQRNTASFDHTTMNNILQSATSLLNGACTSSTFNNTWKSCLGNNTDPKTLFEKYVPVCKQCANHKETDFQNLNKTECKCDLGLVKTSTADKENSDNTVVFLRNSSSEGSSQELRSYDERQLFKPKFGRSKTSKGQYKNGPPQERSFPTQEGNYLNKEKKLSYQDRNLSSQENKLYREKNSESKPERYYPEQESFPDKELITSNKKSDLIGEDDDNKSHKSNVAKITFKTAKEQLLASNPAARRTLGASRKAQGKFVSPMIGIQDKQENSEPVCTDERLKHVDPKMIELIESEIIDKGTPISWDDIAGLQMAKSVIQEAVVWPLLRPDIFTGLRRPPKGILLFGPPGTGKTLIGKCVAAQCNATFFSISASSLTSKWIGDGEKMVRALFAVARCHQPAVIFIDEIDSLLTQRSDTEHEATRRIKTEFLVQFDGASTGEEDRLLIVGATNRPQELDEAARRRLVKRLYIPLPDVEARKLIIKNLLKNEQNDLTVDQVSEIATLTDGYSGADMKSLCSEAAMGPIRAVPLSQIVSIQRDKVRPVCVEDFVAALQRVRPSVSQNDLGQYVKWNNTYGHGL